MKQLYYSSLDAKMKAQREEMNYFQEAQDLQREVQRAQKLNVNLRELANKNLTKVVTNVIKKQEQINSEPAGVEKLYQIIDRDYPNGFISKRKRPQSVFTMIRGYASSKGFTGPIRSDEGAYRSGSDLDKFLKQFSLATVMKELTPILEESRAEKRGPKPKPKTVQAAAPVEDTPPFADPMAEE